MGFLHRLQCCRTPEIKTGCGFLQESSQVPALKEHHAESHFTNTPFDFISGIASIPAPRPTSSQPSPVQVSTPVLVPPSTFSPTFTSRALPSRIHCENSLLFLLISIKPTRSSSPRNGLLPPPSRSISPAHCAQEIGCNASEPSTRPRQLSATETRVSIWMSRGTAVMEEDEECRAR